MANSKLKSQKSNLQSRIDELEGNWKRALADYQNLVKRVEGEKSEIMKLASLNVVNKLVPTLDILELAAAHTSDPGVTMAIGQFHQVLADEGLQEIVPEVGDKFDPQLHECTETLAGEPVDLSSEASAKGETIAEVVRKGYKINGFTLRPARVKVYKNG